MKRIPLVITVTLSVAWRCLVAKCFNGNNGDAEKPRKTSKCA
jgi:hypothetical protein